ncbi:hypothetical protein ACNFJ7_05500 [Sphingomonas sp. HT-1]|uniref:hypothetical protein n=1 Tax=unclassified Sphingomonas TaxID=196159 RepID=UPI00037B0578|nr:MULTISPECIES: hypothetical protein [unclassified Sphingomonas]KTF67509.1 hypothetical protein ATB93_17365 [Sphingomonas sp. WG]
MTTEVRAAANGCGAPPDKTKLYDSDGGRWWPDGTLWCRAGDTAKPAQTWLHATGGRGTHRLVFQGEQVSLLEKEVALAPASTQPPPPPFTRCGTDTRSRAFAAENRLLHSGDLACGQTFRGPDFTLTSAGFQAASGTMPALVTTPAGSSAGTIVYLLGGPYENLLAGLATRATTNHLLARWAGRAAVVVPAYLGIDRVRQGGGDAASARAEVEALLKALERRGPVCVIGFSMGAAVAAPSAARHPHVGFLMAAPLAAAPATFVARVRAKGGAARYFALTPANPSDRAVTMESDKAFLDYFAGSESLDLAALLGPGRHPNVRVAYAAGDLAVTGKDLAALAQMLPTNAIRGLPAAVGHSIEAPFAASAYRPPIDRFLADCLHARG